MLYNLNWLEEGRSFPPLCESDRILRYRQNAALFDGDHFDNSKFRHRNGISPSIMEMYQACASRISRVVGNFEDVISFPVLLNYQRLMTLKMADLVCGEYPSITGANASENKAIKDAREYSDFDEKLYSTVIDISRYGDAVLRVYKDEEQDRPTFTVWDPTEWYPVVSQDGTNTIKYHCICWVENRKQYPDEADDFHLHVQIHGTDRRSWGTYEYRVYKMGSLGSTIGRLEEQEIRKTGVDCCAVMSLAAYKVSNCVYGYDDYMPIDSLLAEIMTRVGQISVILDKHADPNITGPVSMLQVDPVTGERKLGHGKFFAINSGETPPSYMVWDGQLTAAFKELEILINQLYILSEMGAALLGSTDGGSQAVSGTAMRFKMVNPLAKARRISNSLTNPLKKLFSLLCSEEVQSDSVSVEWKDGLPDDPRENIEIAKLATGATKLMPLEDAIMEYFNRSNPEAAQWIKKIRSETEENMNLVTGNSSDDDDDNPNKPGPQDGTGINPQKKGSETGLKNFSGESNKKAD
nr:MAG TPA: portal protein [Caudoviricetes sp.]